MKTLISSTLVMLILVSLSLFSQQVQGVQESGIQTTNGWNFQGMDASIIDSNQTRSFKGTSGNNQIFGTWGVTSNPVGNWIILSNWDKKFSPSPGTPDSVSLECRFSRGTNNIVAIAVYITTQDSFGRACFFGLDNEVPLNSSTWKKFSWNMVYAKNAGIKYIYKFYLEFQIVTQIQALPPDSVYTGSDVEVRNLTFIDNKAGTSIVDFDSNTGVSTEQVQIPKGFALEQNYPNPFNPSTKIDYAITQSGKVKLAVYNLLGTEVAVLVNGIQSAGPHTVRFNAQNLASGVYLYKLQVGDFIEMKKMVLLK